MTPSRSRLLAGALFALGITLLWAGNDPSAGEPKKDESKANEPKANAPLPPVFNREQPESIEDLKAIEAHVEAILPKIVPAVVGVRLGPAQGSGVIIDKEGHVLTAGHVSGKPDSDAQIILPNGKVLKAKTLGRNGSIDSGMVQITDKGDFPFVEMGKSADLKKGQWVMAIGHPGGFRANRTPVVRVGRVLFANQLLIRTDCALVGGDSGGPLFDMNGRVVGIHSRIGDTISANIHVPVDTFRKTWDRLARGESFGGQLGQPVVVQSAGGKLVYDKKATITAKDPLDTKQKDSFAHIHVFKMQAGYTYTIDMISPNGKQLDPYLRLEDSKGNALAEDDDGAGNLNSRIVFRPQKEDEYRIIATTCDPNQIGTYTLVIHQAELKLLAGKIEVAAALHMHKQRVPALVDKMTKEGTKVFTSAFVFDDKGKPVAGKALEFRWDKGKTKVKSDEFGAVRLALSKQNVKDLVLEVPDGLKVTLGLTDAAGNSINLDPEFEKPKKKSAGGKLVLQEEGRLTEKDALDTVRDKGCIFQAHKFRMMAGATYTIDLESVDFDAYLRLEDPSGKQLAEDDDSGGKLNSRIIFTPETEGIYRLIVTTCDPGQTGNYRLNIYEADGKKSGNDKAGDR